VRAILGGILKGLSPSTTPLGKRKSFEDYLFKSSMRSETSTLAISGSEYGTAPIGEHFESPEARVPQQDRVFGMDFSMKKKPVTWRRDS
jgi:hypothetical protein